MLQNVNAFMEVIEKLSSWSFIHLIQLQNATVREKWAQKW